MIFSRRIGAVKKRKEQEKIRLEIKQEKERKKKQKVFLDHVDSILSQYDLKRFNEIDNPNWKSVLDIVDKDGYKYETGIKKLLSNLTDIGSNKKLLDAFSPQNKYVKYNLNHYVKINGLSIRVLKLFDKKIFFECLSCGETISLTKDDFIKFGYHKNCSATNSYQKIKISKHIRINKLPLKLVSVNEDSVTAMCVYCGDYLTLSDRCFYKFTHHKNCKKPMIVSRRKDIKIEHSQHHITPIFNLKTEYPDIVLDWDISRNKNGAEKYSPYSAKNVYWECHLCSNRWNATIKSRINGQSVCSQCFPNESYLQRKVAEYLENTTKYTILHESDCTINPINPRTGYKLRYDNEAIIGNSNLIIEVNGGQHYELCIFHIMSSNKHGTTPQQELEYQQWKDNYKKEYALSQGYSYLEIPYWMDDSGETWKQSIDKTINKIRQEEG